MSEDVVAMASAGGVAGEMAVVEMAEGETGVGCLDLVEGEVV